MFRDYTFSLIFYPQSGGGYEETLRVGLCMEGKTYRKARAVVNGAGEMTWALRG
ncbi:MAG: hypothetical protein LBR38_07795 [Synergistaceae bacterium]|jgi:hypothetical protein|nr:hypothetical protein [Synergistaceae bacterium]